MSSISATMYAQIRAQVEEEKSKGDKNTDVRFWILQHGLHGRDERISR